MANRWEMMVEFRAEWWLFKSMHVNFSPFLKRHGSTVKSLFIEERKRMKGEIILRAIRKSMIIFDRKVSCNSEETTAGIL